MPARLGRLGPEGLRRIQVEAINCTEALRKVRLEKLDDDVVYETKQLDLGVVAVDQIRTVILTFRDYLSDPIDQGGHVPRAAMPTSTSSGCGTSPSTMPAHSRRRACLRPR